MKSGIAPEILNIPTAITQDSPKRSILDREWHPQRVGISLIVSLAMVLVVFALNPAPAHSALQIKAEFLYELQGPTKDSHLNRPTNLYCDSANNEVYVVDAGNQCVRIFGKEGMQIFQFGHDGSLASPIDVAVDKRGDIFVLHNVLTDRVIDVFDFRGKHVKTLELKGMPDGTSCLAEDMAMDSRGNIYISDPRSGCIHSFDSEGQFRFNMIPDMSDKEREEIVFGKLMVDKEDRIYLPISTLGIVCVYDSEGNRVMNFGIQGGGPGKLAFPVDVAVDLHGHILVLDKLRHCLSVYDGNGKYLTEFGGMGNGPGWFFYPSNLEIDRYGRIYVSQRLGDRVQVLKMREEEIECYATHCLVRRRFI